ncbi:Arm DNA-binding domain-containing protein [Burkholderia anthina]|uniref:Arm DNA-binding domain-containing protein n=1 Tax=Burkholderia anthina TaxID=179879 RepID=UPI003132B270
MAKRQTNLLSDIELKHLVRVGLPVAKSDGAGLTFTLSVAGTATWVLRFSHGGRRHELTLGNYPGPCPDCRPQARRSKTCRSPARHRSGGREVQRKGTERLECAAHRRLSRAGLGDARRQHTAKLRSQPRPC